MKVLEEHAPKVDLVLLKHPDIQMRDMSMICVQVYLTPIGADAPILFCQQIMERKLLEQRFGDLPKTWPKLSNTKLDNELGDQA